MIAARQIAFGRGGKRKPYDAEVEYLESTGTQYIDTGFLCSGADEVSITVFINSNDTGFWTYCGAAGNARAWCTSGYCRFGGDNYANIHKYVLIGEWNTITVNKSFTTINGITEPMTLDRFDGVSNLTYQIFSTNGAAAIAAPSLKIASFSWKRNVIIVLNIIPVRFTNENGVSEGAMYDRVSGKLFRNVGTGEFIIGPDVASANGGGITADV